MPTDNASAVSPPKSIEEAFVRLHAAAVAAAAKTGGVFKYHELTLHTPMKYHWMFQVSKDLAEKEHWPPKDRIRWNSGGTYGDFVRQYNIPPPG